MDCCNTQKVDRTEAAMMLFFFVFKETFYIHWICHQKPDFTRSSEIVLKNVPTKKLLNSFLNIRISRKCIFADYLLNSLGPMKLEE